MDQLSPLQTVAIPFSLPSGVEADAVTVYAVKADASRVSLGSASVTAGGDTSYFAEFTLPSDLSDVRRVLMLVSYEIDGEAYEDWLGVGYVGVPLATAEQANEILAEVRAIGTGERVLLISAKDVFGGVRGVEVRIVGSTAKAITRTTGTAQLYVDGGTDEEPEEYTLRFVVPFGYEDVSDRVVSVAEDDVTVDIELVRSVPAVTPPPGACAVTVPVVDQSGKPIEGVTVAAKLLDGYAVAADSMAINAADSMVTDADGLVTLILLREQDYNLSVIREDCSVVLKIRTPDAEAATLGQVVIG